MKKKLALIFCLLTSLLVYGQDAESADSLAEPVSESSVDLDDFFSDDDVTVDEAPAEIPSDSGPLNFSLASLVSKIRFWGKFNSSLGVFWKDDRDANSQKFSAYFEFMNDLGFFARVDESFSIQGSVRCEFPGEEARLDDDAKSVFKVQLYELYFDYIWLDRFYITAGKKLTTWGYPILFSSSTDFKQAARIITNITADSRDGISAMLRIPFWKFNLSGLMLLPLENEASVSMKDASYCASLESAFFHTSLNFFARRSPSDNEDVGDLFGAEIKKSFWGLDVYAQEVSKMSSDTRYVETCIFTGGFYWIGDHFGINCEAQDALVTRTFTNNWRFAADVGVRHLGPDRSTKMVLKWQHDFDYTKKDANFVKFAIINSGIFPHANWNNTVEFFYNPDKELHARGLYKVRVGTSITINVDY